MPIYEYQCAACGRVVEKWQRISEAPLTTCPECGGSLSKLISSCSFHLKGSGWYVTDYHGSHGGRATAPGSPEAGSKAAEGSESSPKTTETEAAGKTEAPAPAKKFK